MVEVGRGGGRFGGGEGGVGRVGGERGGGGWRGRRRRHWNSLLDVDAGFLCGDEIQWLALVAAIDCDCSKCRFTKVQFLLDIKII